MSSFNDKMKSRWTKTLFSKLISRLGRCVQVVTHTEVDCPNCYYDIINHASTNKYYPGGPIPFTVGKCPYCGGKGTINTEVKKSLIALVDWLDSTTNNEFQFLTGGYISGSIARLKTAPCYKTDFDQADFIIVDGYQCKLARPPLLRGLGSKTVLVIYVTTEDK